MSSSDSVQSGCRVRRGGSAFKCGGGNGRTLGDPDGGSCKKAHSDGAYNIKKGEPGYSEKLDRDNEWLQYA
ncbi:excalibur calcium-binding domain-containing protein [Mycobacteroides saopaulense]|uniref:excalibur calcium-binding domain-containing protein n=1 Tax=Mycobacteroides saopaulense TaxID=1578165 RepID=UPI0009F65846|nr:excalibur calcium-binding domain-containing protein [Mycobacteroides saopaulense]